MTMATIAHPVAAPLAPPLLGPHPSVFAITVSGLRRAAGNIVLALAFFAAAWPNLLALDSGLADAIWASGAILMGALSLVRIPPRVMRLDVPALAATAAMLTLPCLMRSTVASAGLVQWSGLTLEVFGVVLSQSARIVMGRRFGILPANRGIVSSGPFGVVRHPIYAGWLMLSLGFAMAYPSWRNFVVMIAAVPASLWRIRVEEGLLAEDPEYRLYRSRIPWMLIPHLL
jgi:protein-S-isoprenylcysteine O-methyltransferase Ste14